MLAAAWAVALLHGALVAFVLTGSLLALRRPRLAYVHAPVALAVLGVDLAGQPCPLTLWELALLEAAGAQTYADGFLGHYLLSPFGLDVLQPSVQAGIYAVAITPNLLGYGVLGMRALRTGRPAGRRADRPGPRRAVAGRSGAVTPRHGAPGTRGPTTAVGDPRV